MFRLVTFPVRVGVRAGSTGTKVGYRTARFLGFRRLFLIGVGVGIGLLVAPTPGRELRAKLRERWGEWSGDEDLGARVRFELSHSPRTSSLPQPAVTTDGPRVTLRGSVPHETARADLERAASSVAGVASVDNLLEIAGTNGAR